ncbi:MAG: nucleotide sugar dehydrogenase, partial [Verrucomicrobiota bacterium]
MDFDIVIVEGLGHVGLPAGLLWADAGLNVGSLDDNESRRAIVASGRMPFVERDAEPMLKRTLGKTFHLLKDWSDLARAKAILVPVGTPVDEHGTPQLSVLTRLAERMLPHLRDGQHIILRSTVYPGTTERLREFFIGKGLRIHLAFCPDRIVAGDTLRGLKEHPHIISSFTPEGRAFCTNLFKKLGPLIVETGVVEAELVKLFTSNWRYVSFAVANQFYMMSETFGGNIREIYRAMTTDYPDGAGISKPGFAAGPSLLKDTMQLSAFQPNDFSLGYAAMQINEGLPSFCVEQIRQNHRLKGMKVGLLGMAYKPGVDDIRDSLSFKLRKLLAFHGAEVLCTDEYVVSDQFLPLET